MFDPSLTRVRRLPVDGGRATRSRVEGMLGNIRLPLQVDIGVDDPINPPPTRLAYPTLLDQPQPVVWVYPRETLIAEKFAAMVVLGRRNSRIKDVWDIAALATDFAFDGPGLQRAVRAHPATTRSLAGNRRGCPRADLLRRTGTPADVVTVSSSDRGSGIRAELACRSRGSGSRLSDAGVELCSPRRTLREGMATGRTVAAARR